MNKNQSCIVVLTAAGIINANCIMTGMLGCASFYANPNNSEN
jgi:hypothetical protein